MRPENLERLGPDDVILASHPGSGTSWIGTLLVELGVFYVSGHDELLVDDRTQRTSGWLPDRDADRAATPEGGLARPELPSDRRERHLPLLHGRDARHPSYREPLRVIHTNQSAFGQKLPNRVLLLVRDGRDAVLSLYHYLRSFSDLSVSFEEFLSGGDNAWPEPALSWGIACWSWIGATPPERLHVLRFEAARARPEEEFQAMLRFLGLERSKAELAAAIEAASYGSMRRAESAGLAARASKESAPRVMRKGKVGEWSEVYTDEMLTAFGGLPRRVLAHFGYSTERLPR